jgi:PAS domain S-box-containing protein
MNKKPTHEELEQISRKLEKETKRRQKAEEALQKSEEMYRDLFENAPNANYSISAEDGSILRCNTAALNLLGYDRAALMGMKVFDLYADTPYGISKAQKVFKRFKKGESIRDVELQMRHKNGYPIWVSLSVEPVKVNGTIIESRSMVIDISERLKTEKRLREAYEIIKRSPAVAFLWKNIEGWPVEFVSENVMELLGYSTDDFVSDRVLYAKVVHPDDLERVAGEVANFSIGKERKRFTHEPYRIVTKDGKIKWLADRTYIRRDEKGKITHYQGIVSDISDQVRAEKELEKRTNDLNERVKELNSLYGISQLVEKRGISLEEIIQGTANLIPTTWQYPEITCARIMMGDQEFKTKNFRKTDWRQACDIIVHGELSGTVEVYYLEEKPACHEGPFLQEERTMINTIAQRLARITERKRTEKEVRCLKEKYEDLYHNAPIMYLSLDTNGIITECNNAILDKLGYSKRKIIGKHMTTFLTEESVARFKAVSPELIKTGKLMGVERQLITKSGKIIDVQLSVSGEYDEHGKLIKTRASFEDISGLKRADEHIHSLTHALINAHESERQMISRELHDRIAQDLSTLKIGFDTLLYNQTAVSLEESQKAAGFSEIFKNTIAAVRDLSYDLRPPLLDEMGLVEAISNFCESFSEAHGLNVHFNAAGMDNLRLNFETEINLYRLVQEGLNNIRKHADAADAFVKLVAASPNIILRIEDNGQGFDVARRLEAATNEKRMGLRSMEERTCLLGGKIAVESLPLKGTKILIKIPQNKGKHGSKNIHSDR